MGRYSSLCKDSVLNLKYQRQKELLMDLTSREVAFLADEMERVENSEGRYPSEKREASRIREEMMSELAE